MRRALLNTHRAGVAALMIAIAATFLANCVYAVAPTPEEQACCAAMGDDCGAMAQEHVCCTADASTVQPGPVAKQLALTAPPQSLEAIIVYAEPPRLASQWSLVSDGAVLKPPGVATYLLDSTFRI